MKADEIDPSRAAIAVFLMALLLITQISAVSATTYRVNDYEETEFHYGKVGEIAAYGTDSYVLHGYEGMTVSITISCNESMRLNVRNSRGSFIFHGLDAGDNNASFHIDTDDMYYIELIASNFTNYSIRIDSEYTAPEPDSLVEYVAYSICALSLLIVVTVLTLVFILHRANQRAKRNIQKNSDPTVKEDKTDDGPYRIK